MAHKGDASVKGITDLHALLKQRTWDKEVILWLGSEKSLVDACHSTNHVILDLLDLFDPDDLPLDDDETHDALCEHLRQRLKAISKGPDNRTILIVKSIGLLTRYRLGLREFYDWFIGSHTVVALVLEALSESVSWPEEVSCDSKYLLDYFAQTGMVKDVYAFNG
jgi:hypothetical protein